MREFVLNDGSLEAAASRAEAMVHLRDVAKAAASLVARKIAISVLRSTKPLMELPCSAEDTFWGCLQGLHKNSETRDEGLFLSRMATKSPIYADLPIPLADRYWGVQEIAGSRLSATSLILCAITDSIAVSLPTDLVWDRDALTIPFNEMSLAGEVEPAEEPIDNIARSRHVDAIAERGRARLSGSLSAASFWENRGQAFPDIAFAPCTREQVEALNTQDLQLVLRRLGELNHASREWKAHGGAAPTWRSKVSPESEKVCQNPMLRAARTFKGEDGFDHFYEWHARCGSGRRIHFRLDAEIRVLEIGYVGNHLPLG